MTRFGKNHSTANLPKSGHCKRTKPIGNLIGLLETHGVRVFSLSENTAAVDAFSFWRDQKPYISLNNFKTAERSIFDAAHELGHLVMHRHGGPRPSRSAAREANRIRGCVSMPENDVTARIPRFITVDIIIPATSRKRAVRPRERFIRFGTFSKCSMQFNVRFYKVWEY
jgi:Zn-dependent peptidase ImmA (M78 family)